MDLTDCKALAKALLPAVLQAGRVEMGYFHGGTEIKTKSDDSPVTAADHEAEAILVAALNRIAPGVPVVAEETVAAHGLPPIGQAFFLVDPLDGTREFVAGRDEFTINVGLVVDHRPVFGMVYAPARNHLFFNLAADSAVEARLAPDAVAPDVTSAVFQPIRSRDPVRGGLVGLQSRSKRPDGDAFLDGLGVRERHQLGSSVKFCLVARGEADLYVRLGPTSEWDTAAGHAILAAAGGRVTTMDGAELTYGRTSDKFINPHFVAWGRNPLK
jgi:3'(2'), 5'-bisphosphate nucleotidase